MSSTLLERSNEDFKLISFVTHPKRIQILKELVNANEPLYIAEIAAMIQEKTPRNTSFHLLGLSERGLVEGHFREVPGTEKAGAGRAAKFYNLTEKGTELMEKLGEIQLNI